MAGGSQFDSAYKERTGSCRTDYYKVGGRHRIRERPKWGRASYLILLGSTTKLTSTFGWLHVKCLLQYINIVIRYDSAKASDCVDHKLWKILKEMGIPDHLTCLLRNLYAGQEATVRTGHGTTDWFQIRKGVCQGCILSPCLSN